jgi:hypothetical protein
MKLNPVRELRGHLMKSIARFSVVLCVLSGCFLAPVAGTATITQIRIVGQSVKIFDIKQRVEAENISDGPVNAWREADGTVNLMLPSYEAYRLRGPNLLNLTLDRNKIYSAARSAGYVKEDLYNLLHWPLGPYSLDGRNFYSLAHHEWYGALLDPSLGGIAKWPGWAVLAKVGHLNSFVTSVTSMKSTDGGASWQINRVNGNHVVAKPGHYWTGSVALANRIYMKASNITGLQQITRMIREGNYYYAMGNLYQRDFTKINAAAGVYQAPMVKEGIVLIRTTDFRNPNGWEAWTGGSTYEPVSNGKYETFHPKSGGTTMATWSPTFIYDTNAQAYILIFCDRSKMTGPIFYMTSKTLASPSWSDYAAIQGSQQVNTDPAVGPDKVGFNAAHFPSIIDPSSSGFNFESTSSGSPWLFWSTAPGIYNRREFKNEVFRVQLSITYATPRGPRPAPRGPSP